MPFALVAVGLLMIITGINNTYSQSTSQLQSDFGGSKGFIVWIIALGSVGALGYINDLRQFSHYFMALILISMILANKGVFGQFSAAIARGPIAPHAPTNQPSLSATSSTESLDNAIKSNQSGVGGSDPVTAGQGKFNGWMNYFLGLGTNSIQ